MAAAVQVIHIEKRISIASGLNRHITRQQFETEGDNRVITTWVPNNADPSKTANNVELVSRKSVNSQGQEYELTLQKAVDKRIQEAGIKPRKGQARCLEMIFSGSHERMTSMNREELLQWANDTVSWAKKTWGEDNVVSASLHVDELTPHIHMIVVPIVSGQSRRTKHYQTESGKNTKQYNINHNKLRLCVNEVYTTGKLYDYHDSYAQEVSSKYGLERGVKAEPGSKKKHTNSIEYNRQLAKEAAEQENLIKELTSDYKEKTRKADEYLSLQKEIIGKNKNVIDGQLAEFNGRKEELTQIKAEIVSNKATIAQQKQTISDNRVTIEQQEKLKASPIINDDAADQRILEKYKSISELSAEENRLNRSIVDKKTELATVTANVDMQRAQLAAKVDLKAPQKKGMLGKYDTDEVDNYISSVANANLIKAMNKVPRPVKIDEAIQKEIARLRQVEDDYKDLMNSPERLQQRIEYLETEAKQRSIANILEYVLRRVVQVLRFTVDKTPQGDDVFVKFKIEGSPQEYAGCITPEEYICYTSRQLNSLQEVKEHSRDKIWIVPGYLSEIRAKREKEDIIKRYSTKLSILTKENIQVKDFISDGNHYLFFAANGKAYEVDSDGSTWSTSDERVRTLGDCEKYSQEDIWEELSNINSLKIDSGMKL